ncbi:MAG: coenzyme F420-0:L-glutamate ligase [Firmicutes bacterium]|nr:coenzyme F420-0:L-glutamate ligase [Bacillota bacterium]
MGIYAVIVINITAILYIVFAVYTQKLGDCQIELETGKIDNKIYTIINDNRAKFVFHVPISETGKKQLAMIIDCAARVQPEGSKYYGLNINAKVNNLNNPRDDGYFEAIVMKKGSSMTIQITLDIESPGRNIREVINRLNEIKVDFLYKYYCRNPIKNKREVILLDPRDFKEAKLSELPPPVPAPEAKIPADSRVIPVKTPLLVPGDNLSKIIKDLASPFLSPGSIVALAESAVAITQGRIKYVEDIEPGFLARRLNKFFNEDSSLCSVYGMEMAIREAGAVRILIATITGILGKLIGRSGDFYRVAGKDVATIDDATGTIPPFDKFVVMGPKDPAGVVQKIKEDTGFDAAIVDVNDLRRVDVLAITDKKYKKLLEEALVDNPQGNACQQTPLLVIKTE